MGKQTLLRWIEEAEAKQVRAAAMQRRSGLAAGGDAVRHTAVPSRPRALATFTTTLIGRWRMGRVKGQEAAC